MTLAELEKHVDLICCVRLADYIRLQRLGQHTLKQVLMIITYVTVILFSIFVHYNL